MSTAENVVKAVAEHLGLNPEDLDQNSLLREDLGLGPIELNDLLLDLSSKFNVSFNPDEVENLHKVEDLILLVEDNLLD